LQQKPIGLKESGWKSNWTEVTYVASREMIADSFEGRLATFIKI
jgi:hypothetical protein